MREKLPQAYIEYVEDNFLSITQNLGEKIILQEARMNPGPDPVLKVYKTRMEQVKNFSP